jgi:putative nucleotidyltransferase with HDIG domain
LHEQTSGIQNNHPQPTVALAYKLRHLAVIISSISLLAHSIIVIMSKKQIHISRSRIAIVILSIVICAAFLLTFAPRQTTQFGYEYQPNKPWRYSTLIAEFDFPVLRSETEQQHLRDSIRNAHQPYYQVQAEIGTQQLALFKQDIAASKFSNVPQGCLKFAEDQLRRVYAEGILSPKEYGELKTTYPNGIRVVSAQRATQKKLDDIFSTRTAYKSIITADSLQRWGTLLQTYNLNAYLQPNLSYDSRKNTAVLEDAYASIGQFSTLVQAGQKIISQGDIVTPGMESILNSLKDALDKRQGEHHSDWWVLLGQFLFATLVFLALFTYIYLFRRDYMERNNVLLLLFTLNTSLPLITYLTAAHTSLSVYIIPFAIVPMFVRIFLDTRTSLVVTLVIALLSSLVATDQYEFLLVQILVGFNTIYSLKEVTERSQVLRVAFFNILVAWVVCFSLDLVRGITFTSWDDILRFDYHRYVDLAISGGLQLLAYPLMYVVERIFGFTSSVTLIELMNFNEGLLSRMSREAKGTFNHTIQVSNLAAEVARAIGAKPLLARVGALYHDIGKLENPVFFTENQSGVNPHDNLDELTSARIIIDHVNNGLRLAEEYSLPQVVREFITTHHGKGMAKYFAIQWQNKHPEETFNPEAFTYPGHYPNTAEQAALMMCDAVEAASRSLKEYTEESISNLVNKIIDTQLREGCYNNCPITFADIDLAKQTLIESLMRAYHTRIAYPELK